MYANCKYVQGTSTLKEDDTCNSRQKETKCKGETNSSVKIQDRGGNNEGNYWKSVKCEKCD